MLVLLVWRPQKVRALEFGVGLERGALAAAGTFLRPPGGSTPRQRIHPG